MIERLVIVGVGLIGGSLGLALRRAGAVREIVGIGRSRENLELARERGIIDTFAHDIAEAGLERADMVFLATPPETVAELAAAVRPRLSPGAILTDGASTKGRLCERVAPLFALPEKSASAPEDGPAFVAGHPIAGTEKSGAGAAFEALYEAKRTILTPVDSTPTWALDKVRAMWEAAGAVVEVMTPERHDTVFAGVSHLPHAVAFALVEAVRELEMESGVPVLRYAAGGFADITRIASSDPTMWRDIFRENRSALLHAVGLFEREIASLREMIEKEDGQGLHDYIARARATRNGLLEKERT